jgi:cysteine desulfurase/selenocysteine lyase
LFIKKTKDIHKLTARPPDFDYIKSDDAYMDSACQSMRPQTVIDALNNYYKTYNACGGRVKYEWGKKVDDQVDATRNLVVDYFGLPKKDYVCSFTLNTTYGLNLILSQLPTGTYQQIITSEIEHNSVFLPTIELAKRLGVEREVLKRDDKGNLIYTDRDMIRSVIVVNAASNIDGQLLLNIEQLVKDAHSSGGIVIIDAAQATAHCQDLLIGCEADAYCFSAHKMYAASLGVVVIRKNLLETLDKNFVGGGMIETVQEQSYTLLPKAEMASWLEPGLQAYGEIISLKRAIEWLKTVRPGGLKPSDYITKLSDQLFQGLSNIPGVTIVNKAPSPVISFYNHSIDAHRLAIFLSGAGIKARSGYFCCHYYLLEKLKTPPLLRISIGLHVTENDIIRTLEAINKFTRG